MTGGLRYGCGREMPLGMQELYAVQKVGQMISDGHITKETGIEVLTTQLSAGEVPERDRGKEVRMMLSDEELQRPWD